MATQFYKKKKPIPLDTGYVPNGSEESLSKSITDLGLHPKSLEVLTNGKITNVRDIAIRTEKDLFKMQNFSKKTLIDISRAIDKLGISLRPMPELPTEKTADSTNESAPQTEKPQSAQPILTATQKTDNGQRPQSNFNNRQESNGQANSRLPQNNNNREQTQRQNNRDGRPQANGQNNRFPQKNIANGAEQVRQQPSGSFKDLINNSLQNQGGNEGARRDNRYNNRDNKDNRDTRDNNRDNKDNRDTRDNNRDNRNIRGNNHDNRQNSNGQQRNEQRPHKTNVPIDPNALIKYMIDGKYGYKNGRSEVIIPARYDELFTFKEELACFEQKELYGFIDRQNNIVIPADKYQSAMSFSEGLAVVMFGEKYGYINKENETVIPFQFDAATCFENSQARVKLDGKWGVIEKDGTVKWNLK